MPISRATAVKLPRSTTRRKVRTLSMSLISFSGGMNTMPETGVDAGPRNDQPGTAPVERKAMTAPDLPRPVHPPHPVDPRLERNKRVVRRFFEHFAAGAVPAAI